MKKIILLSILSIFIIKGSEAQWVQMSNVMGTTELVYRLTSNGTYIFAGTIGTGIYRTSNNGENWIVINNGIPFQAVPNLRGLTVNGNTLFAAFANGYGIYRSTDNGDNWIAVNTGIPPGQHFSCIVTIGTNIFAGNSWAYVYISTNNGTSWNLSSNGLPSASINSIVVSGMDIFVGTYMNKVYRSINNGGSWSFAGNGLPIQTINCLAVSGTNLFAGTDTAGFGGVYISTNNGSSWTQTSLPNTNVYGLTANGNNLFAGTWHTTNSGVFVSTNNGVNWYIRNEGFSNNIGTAPILLANNYIFAGTNQSVWRRPLSEIIGIQNIGTEIPISYSLGQNYPNPFNPTTKIRFDVPKQDFISINIFDILGREVATLVNEQLKPGTYEVDWNGSSYTSGVYFYKLLTDNYTETKKMLMIK